MAGQTRTWKIGDSWNKVAYAYYGDSREFRRVIELNESYDIRVVPAQGARIFVTGPDGTRGKNPSSGSAGSPGTLNQLSPALNLSRTSQEASEPIDIATAIFPWDSLDDFSQRLANYTAYSLLERDRINGYGLDSPQASSDIQRG